MLENFNNLLILRYNAGKSNKVWGMFSDSEGVWINFWCAWGTSPQFKVQGINEPAYVSSVITKNKKLKKHYYVISLDDTIKEWPDFLDSLESRFAWFKINL